MKWPYDLTLFSHENNNKAAAADGHTRDFLKISLCGGGGLSQMITHYIRKWFGRDCIKASQCHLWTVPYQYVTFHFRKNKLSFTVQLKKIIQVITTEKQTPSLMKSKIIIISNFPNVTVIWNNAGGFTLIIRGKPGKSLKNGTWKLAEGYSERSHATHLERIGVC